MFDKKLKTFFGKNRIEFFVGEETVRELTWQGYTKFCTEQEWTIAICTEPTAHLQSVC